MPPILFFDFDGVLFDTVREAFVVACRTCDMEPDFSGPLYKEFRRCRTFVGPAWNYYDVMESLQGRRSPIHSSDDFIPSEQAASFEKLFFKTRLQMRTGETILWLDLNRPYPFAFDLCAIIDKRDDIPVYIVTTKDTATVAQLLEHHAITIVPKNRILGQEIFSLHGSKRQIITGVMNESGSEALFVDDLAAHLDECEGVPGLTLACADWGYGTTEPRDPRSRTAPQVLDIVRSKLKE